MAEAELVLEARGLHKKYSQGESTVEVLHGINLSVRAGDFIAILGPSGSGKSTLLNLLGLLVEPSSGEIVLFGKSTRGLDEKQRASLRNRRLGFIFQFDSLLPEFSVLENVMMPGRIALKGQNCSTLMDVEIHSRELLAVLDILPLANRFPAQLSGGERQRAAIARALVNRPAVLLADEPTGNLDRHNAELVFSQSRELAQRLGVAILMVTHNEHVAQFASKPIHLTDGCIAEG